MENNLDLAPCDCPDFKPSSDSINGCIGIAFVHGSRYTGKSFIYCPWCGTKLKPVSATTVTTEEP